MNHGSIINKSPWTLLDPIKLLLWAIYEKIFDRLLSFSFKKYYESKVSQSGAEVDFPFSLLGWIFYIYYLMGSFLSKYKYYI